MTFDPQNNLESSLVQAASDPAHRPQFYKDLVAADLFVIQDGPAPDKAGQIVLKEAYPLRLQSMQWNGKSYLPVFSSLPRLQAGLRTEAGYVALNALEFMKITQGANLILNPGADYGKELTAEEIATIIDGSIWKPNETHVVKAATRVLFGQPANYPTELIAALIRYFKKTKEVRTAFIAHFFNPQRDEKAHTLIGIEVTGNWDEVMAGAGMIARDVPCPDPPVEFMQITGKAGVEDYFRRECKPFYKRKRFGLF